MPRPGPRDIVDGYSFDAIDQYALDTPTSAENSIKSLADYLTKPARNDVEKARAIYRWITENISYDVDGFLTKNYGDESPIGVLSSRRSVCEGYSRLFEGLARDAGLEVVTVGGWAKGIGFSVGDPIDGPANHAWNALRLNGGWYLIDSTWGAGSVGDDQRFVQRFADYYFLTPPEQFIYEHLPEDPRWELLETVISKTGFVALPYLRDEFFKYGLKLGSHNQSVVEINTEVAITIFAPDDVLLLTQLEQNGQELPKSLTFVQRETGNYVVSAVFPRVGDYILRIFAGPKGGTDGKISGKLALDYKIKVSAGLSGSIGFPETYGTFAEAGAYLYGPMTGYLQSGTTQTFKLIVPGAEKVAVIIGDKWYPLEKQGELFEGKVSIPNGELGVYAKFPNDKQYWGLLIYTGF